MRYAVFLLLPWVACDSADIGPVETDEIDADTDTDADSDADSDADTDSDTDTDTDTDADTDADTEVFVDSTVSGKTSSSGLLEVAVEVGPNDSSLMVDANGGQYLSLEEIRDPDDRVVFQWEEYYDSDESLTLAIFPYTTQMVVNWPIRNVDEDLTPGTWTVSDGWI